MKIILSNKTLFFSLVIYFVGQLLLWYVAVESIGQAVLFLHEGAYLTAIAIGCILLWKSKKLNRIKIFGKLLLLFFVVNFLLFLYWFVNAHMNPAINWHLKGNPGEVDPFYLIIYFPIINFLVVLTIFFLAILIKYLSVQSIRN